MIDFNPNEMKPPAMPQYATYIPRRNPQFKIHKNVGHAKNAINGSGEGILYQYIETEWVEIDRCEKPTECAHCHGPLYIGKGWRHYGYQLSRHPATPAYKKPHVCEPCYSTHFSYYSKEEDRIPEEYCGLVSPLG